RAADEPLIVSIPAATNPSRLLVAWDYPEGEEPSRPSGASVTFLGREAPSLSRTVAVPKEWRPEDLARYARLEGPTLIDIKREAGMGDAAAKASEAMRASRDVPGPAWQGPVCRAADARAPLVLVSLEEANQQRARRLVDLILVTLVALLI